MRLQRVTELLQHSIKLQHIVSSKRHNNLLLDSKQTLRKTAWGIPKKCAFRAVLKAPFYILL